MTTPEPLTRFNEAVQAAQDAKAELVTALTALHDDASSHDAPAWSVRDPDVVDFLTSFPPDGTSLVDALDVRGSRASGIPEAARNGFVRVTMTVEEGDVMAVKDWALPAWTVGAHKDAVKRAKAALEAARADQESSEVSWAAKQLEEVRERIAAARQEEAALMDVLARTGSAGGAR